MKRRIPPYLKNKYPPVADFMSGSGFKIEHFHVEKRMRVSRICNSKLRSDQSRKLAISQIRTKYRLASK
jgi:hypothetical protein